LNTEKVQEFVEVLEQENPLDAGGRQRDLTQLASRIVHLDFDLRTMLLDCAVLGRQSGKKRNWPLINSLHRSLDIMHNLLNDLNCIKPSLDRANLEPSNLRHLFSDWFRFKKSVRDMQISLQHTHMRRKMTDGGMKNAFKASNAKAEPSVSLGGLGVSSNGQNLTLFSVA
jgi:hypothetical protein